MVVFKCKNCDYLFHTPLKTSIERYSQKCPNCDTNFSSEINRGIKHLTEYAEKSNVEVYLLPKDTEVSIKPKF